MMQVRTADLLRAAAAHAAGPDGEKRPAGRRNPARAEADGAELSHSARAAMATRRTMAGLPAVRAQRVQELRQLILGGGYQPDTGAVAQRLLASGVLDL